MVASNTFAQGVLPSKPILASGCRALLTRAIFPGWAAVEFLSEVQAMAPDGLVTLRSGFGVKATLERLEAEAKAKGMTVFARIDHAAGAKEAGLSLRPTTVLIFGNAKGGTPTMQSAQTIGIDLPLKVLVWQDEAGNTWLSYNDPRWFAKRHGLSHDSDTAVSAMTAALAAAAKAATASL